MTRIYGQPWKISRSASASGKTVPNSVIGVNRAPVVLTKRQKRLACPRSRPTLRLRVCVCGGGFIGLRWVTHEHLDASCNLGIPEVVKNFELAQDSLILMDAQRAPVRQLRHRFGPRRTPLFPSPHVPCGMFYLLPHADRVLTAGLAIRCSDVLIGC